MIDILARLQPKIVRFVLIGCLASLPVTFLTFLYALRSLYDVLPVGLWAVVIVATCFTFVGLALILDEH